MLQEDAAFPKFHTLEVEIPPAYNTNKRVTISLSEASVMRVLFLVMYIIFWIPHVVIKDPPLLHGYRRTTFRACNGCVRSWTGNLSHMFLSLNLIHNMWHSNVLSCCPHLGHPEDQCRLIIKLDTWSYYWYMRAWVLVASQK